MIVRANELRAGDKLSINGAIRTVDTVHSGTAETRVALVGSAFPASFILWNGQDCHLAGEYR